ncbi:MAG: FHA domain-containing protein [Anaerolineae bacterium]|nr:FHA domain-containing protein [Anaerolineae bacterium]
MRLSESSVPSQAAVPPFHTSRAGSGWQVTLLVHDERSVPLQLTVSERAILGRPDEVDGFMPEIDTTPFHGRDKGVSRRHAEFTIIDEQLHVRDLGSTNGTRLNGQLLQPNRFYRVREGDLLQFGNLYMLVKLS